MPPSRQLAVLVTALACVVPMCRGHAQHMLRLTPANGRVAIWNLVGSARVEAGTSDAVEVEFTPRGADAGGLIVRSGLIDGAQTLRIFHPSDAIRAPESTRLGHHYSTTLRLRDDGRFDAPNNTGRRVRISDAGGAEASADLVIRVPVRVALELHLGLGDIGASGTTSALSIETAAGTVRTSDTRGAMHIETGSGSVAITTHFGDLDVDTGSGFVSATDISAATNVSIETGSGSLNVSRCRASDRLRLETGSGRIVAVAIAAASMSLDTGSGSVEVSPSSDAGDLHVDTGSGSVTLIAPSGFSADLTASAGSGGITSDLPIEIMRRDRGELRGRIGSGRARVSLETGSGGIVLRGRRSTTI
jgi:lia operon protein LiaG